MRDDIEKFQVSEVPEAVWDALVAYYRTSRELIDLIKREEELHPITRGFQIANRNAKRFRKALRDAIAKDERYAAPVYFDWLEDQEKLADAIEKTSNGKDDDDTPDTFDAKAVKSWLDDGVDSEIVWIYMHCSADKFPPEAFDLVEKKQ